MAAPNVNGRLQLTGVHQKPPTSLAKNLFGHVGERKSMENNIRHPLCHPILYVGYFIRRAFSVHTTHDITIPYAFPYKSTGHSTNTCNLVLGPYISCNPLFSLKLFRSS